PIPLLYGSILLLVRVAADARTQELDGFLEPLTQFHQNIDSGIRPLAQKVKERIPAECECDQFSGGSGVGRTSLSREHEHITVDLSGSQRLQHHLLPIGIGEPNLHLTLFNKKEGSFWVIGIHDDLARLKAPLPHDRTKLSALFVMHSGEEGYLSKELCCIGTHRINPSFV